MDRRGTRRPRTTIFKVDVGGAPDQVVDVPARIDDAVRSGDLVPVNIDIVRTLVALSSGYGVE